MITALGAGTLAAALFAALNDLAPREKPLSFALVFLGWSVLFYAALLCLILLAAEAVARLTKAAWVARSVLVLFATGVLAACILFNQEALGALFRLDGPVRFRWLAPVSFLLAIAALLAASVLPARRRAALRALGLAAPLTAALAFLPAFGASPTAQARPPAELGPADPQKRFVLIGIDGADWDYIEPLIARGDLPHLAALRERGAWGKLKTLVPTDSPVIWTTIATGQRPAVHGVTDFTCLRVRGVPQPFREPRLPAALGFERLYAALGRMGLVFRSPIVSTARQVPAYWNLATAHGSPVAVLNWWATWPAEPTLGYMVSERLHYWRFAARGAAQEASRLTYPEELYDEIAPLLMRPDEVRREHALRFMDVSPAEFEAMMAAPYTRDKRIETEFKYIYSMFETERRVALDLIERSRRRFGAPSDLMLLFRIVDLASHCALAESELVGDHLDAREEDIRRYGRVVSEAYRAVDRAIGQILDAFGSGNVVIVSDHGFALETTSRRRVYQHLSGPAGIFLAAGPAFRTGRVSELTVYDVLPLLAYLKGFPVAMDLKGRLPRRAFDLRFFQAHRVQRVASYGRRTAAPETTAPSGMDDAVLERLRAVGYLQ